MCDFLSVTTTNLPPILHRFRDIAAVGGLNAILDLSKTISETVPDRRYVSINH